MVNANSWQPLKKVAFSWHWNYKMLDFHFYFKLFHREIYALTLNIYLQKNT